MWIRVLNEMMNQREPYPRRRLEYNQPLSQTVFFQVGGSEPREVTLQPGERWEGDDADLPESSRREVTRLQDAGAVSVLEMRKGGSVAMPLRPAQTQAPRPSPLRPSQRPAAPVQAAAAPPPAPRPSAPADPAPADPAPTPAPLRSAASLLGAGSRPAPLAAPKALESAPPVEADAPEEDLVEYAGAGTPSARSADVLNALLSEDEGAGENWGPRATAEDLVGSLPDRSTREARLSKMSYKDTQVLYQRVTRKSAVARRQADMHRELLATGEDF